MTLQLRSLLKSTGDLEISLVDAPAAEPQADEVVVRVDATPINPSDLGLLLALADPTSFQAAGTPERPVALARVPEKVVPGLKARWDQSLPVGNEGAGTVVRAGSSPQAQALLGKAVAMAGGSMYAQERLIRADQCMVIPAGCMARDAASWYVNPMTALSMTETMRREGHTALVHTAAASNLGQMLNRICLKDGIGLVNIVRRAEQAELLKSQGAQHVINTSDADFMAQLTDALAETGATIAFDAIGGGKLPGQILTCMEAAINRKAQGYSRYGSEVHKQVYLYGNLDRMPTEIARNVGMAWGVAGWLLTPFLQRIGREDTQRLKQRVMDELTTTFKSGYTQEVTLAGALDPKAIATYGKAATGEKYLIRPNGV
ncbi:NADH oxidase [Comamonas serinivorans]|uniref:NADH oxidase n=1 Tax=Comamonas serinivorans TaxID=1082851 RepID=A0A1Y0ER88_9BURK|nr:zinc-binding dehydrogenase [Comamonas serinivorans]ARU06018.1 NADH oxidase [Comamonas serinivorans]